MTSGDQLSFPRLSHPLLRFPYCCCSSIFLAHGFSLLIWPPRSPDFSNLCFSVTCLCRACLKVDVFSFVLFFTFFEVGLRLSERHSSPAVPFSFMVFDFFFFFFSFGLSLFFSISSDRDRFLQRLESSNSLPCSFFTQLVYLFLVLSLL